jgi:chloride channel 3/4/5
MILAGEVCTEWQTWSDYLNVRSLFLGGALHWLVYVFLAVGFASSAAVLVRSYAPYAFHTGSEYTSFRLSKEN